MNTYNSAQLAKLNISAVMAAKQATKQELLVKRDHYNTQLDKLICKGVHTDLDNTLFNRLQNRLAFIRVGLLNIKTFEGLADRRGVSLVKRSFVSLSKTPLAKVQLSSVSLARGL
jgi:hypothetical protein